MRAVVRVAGARAALPRLQGVRSFTGMVAADPRLEATVLQTVGVKGHDGFMLIRVASV